MNRERTQQGLADYIKQRLDGGQRPQVCGGNGGDGVYYHLPVGGGAWGNGEIFISFTNHGYCDKPSDFDPYLDSIEVRAY